VRVGDDQPHPGQAPGGQRAQERQPARSNVAPVWRPLYRDTLDELLAGGVLSRFSGVVVTRGDRAHEDPRVAGQSQPDEEVVVLVIAAERPQRTAAGLGQIEPRVLYTAAPDSRGSGAAPIGDRPS
jgi:hypothetical protein